VFPRHVGQLAHAHPVFSGACAPEIERAFHHPVRQRTGRGQIFRPVRVDQQDGVEIAIAHMAQDRAGDRANLYASPKSTSPESTSPKRK